MIFWNQEKLVTFPQNGQIYLYLCIVSNFFINLRREEPYLTPYFLEIPTFLVLFVIVFDKDFFKEKKIFVIENFEKIFYKNFKNIENF